MEQEKLNDYTVRITQANPTGLVVITYEIIEDSLQAAKEAHSKKEYILFEKELKRVQKLFHELVGSLDFRYRLSFELLELYRFCGRCVVDAIYQKKTEELLTVSHVVSKLHEAFLEVSRQDTGESVMKNTQTLYAGLTYGKYSLNEVSLETNPAGRGFKA